MKAPVCISKLSLTQALSKMVLLLSFSLLSACFINDKYIPKNNKGERLLNTKVNYTFNSKPNPEDLKKVDISAYYVQTFIGRCHNFDEMKTRAVIQFDKEGYFKKSYLHNFKLIPKKITNKNDIYYGGKYKVNSNSLLFEEFYPTSGGKTDYFTRVIQKGKLINDFMIIGDHQYTRKIYKKLYQLPTQPIESLREAIKDCSVTKK